MAKLDFVAGATSQSDLIFIQDSSSTTGAGLSGLVFNTSGLTAYYTFAGANATAVAITLATLAAVNSAWSSGGFKEIDATNMKGWYRFDIPNAALAASKGQVVGIHFQGATNMAPLAVAYQLTGWNNQDGVRGGLTALPNAAANAAGGLPISTAGALDLDEMNVDIEAIQTSTAGLTYTVANQVDVNVLDWKSATAPAMTGDSFARLGAPAGASVSADIAAVKVDTAAVKVQTDKLAFTVANQVDSNVIDWKGAAAPAMTGDAFARLGAPAGASVSADVAAVKTDTAAVKVQTDKMTFTVANVIDANALRINGVALAAQALAQSASSICWGTCSGGTTTTAVVSTLNNPSSLGATGQLIGRTIIFPGNTGSANLESQASNITNSTTGATPTLTFTAMTTAPANGDVFVVI
jgi:hypothetical protein